MPSSSSHRCTTCGEDWASAPVIDQNGMHTDPHGDGCAGPIEFTPVAERATTEAWSEFLAAVRARNPDAAVTIVVYDQEICPPLDWAGMHSGLRLDGDQWRDDLAGALTFMAECERKGASDVTA